MSTHADYAGAQATGIRQLGDFILLEEIGRGGMGMVYRARQISLDREVALKVLPSFAGIDPESVARFQREAEAAGRLSHPGIVPIYVVGNIDGTWFFAMELVAGPSLFQMLEGLSERSPAQLGRTIFEETAMASRYPDWRATPIPSHLAESAYPASCAALIMEVAGALTVAHLGKVIHRDLKPSNILLHPTGRPVLVDFGLARDELAFSVTQTGDAVGTPAYMAPEQAAGNRTVDARVDVYGLGATLYEMLTLRPPFEGNHSGEIMQAILDEDPVPPCRLNPTVPKALDIIVLTCLAKDPADRYRSAADLQSDLRAFLAGGKIRARRPGWLAVLGRRYRRNRRSAYAVAVAVMAAVFVGLMVGLVFLNNTRQSGRLALDEARLLLLDGRPREAHAAYVQARVLLDDPRFVAERRFAMFSDVFPMMYAKGRRQVLAEFLDTLPADELDQPGYHDFRRRLQGVGQLRVRAPDGDGHDEGTGKGTGEAGEGTGEGDGGGTGQGAGAASGHAPRSPTVEVSVRGMVGEEFESDWRPLPSDGMLGVGRYLVRLAAAGMVASVQGIEITRDAEMELLAYLQPRSEVPAGMCLVAPSSGQAPFAVDRTEMATARYAALLRTVGDPALAAELVPGGWLEDGRPELPVRGLSHRQARIAAALSGRHLLSAQEYLEAATGGLRDLQYPWGGRFDVERVVGDPRYASEPAAADSRPSGASPSGILHLVGNLAEPLAAAGDGRLLVAGGHYLSAARDLTVHGLQPRAGIDEQSPHVGLRFARFLPTAGDPAAAAAVRARLAQLAASDQPYVANQWRIGADGRVFLRQDLAASAGVTSLVFPGVSGFVARTTPLVRDRAGATLECRERRPGTRAQDYEVTLVAAAQPVHLSLQRELEPLGGLSADGDGYRLLVPLTSRAEFAIDRVELPAGCQVDEAWPRPDVIYNDGAAPVLVWHRGLPAADAEAGVDAAGSVDAALEDSMAAALADTNRVAVVRFRRDGALTTCWPSLAPVRGFVDRFFRSLAAADPRALAPLLAPDCRFMPQDWDHAEALRNIRGIDAFSDVSLHDVTAVGDILTVELRCRWQPRAVLRFAEGADNWAIRLLLRRRASGLNVVRLLPSTRSDLGRVVDGTYRHQLLEASLSPPAGTVLERTVDGLVELQVELRPVGARDVWLNILGCLGSATDSARAVRMRLIASREAGGRGERVAESQVEHLGPAGGRRLAGARERWLFRTRDGTGWRSERWTFVRLGNRHFLIKAVATGATRSEAQRALVAAEPWYRTVTDALRID